MTTIEFAGSSRESTRSPRVVADMPSPDSDFQATVYGDVIPWERPVQYAAEFFIEPGDTVLDLGGNTGGVAIAFSRMVGETGKIYCFECNPRMINWIKADCVANNVRNVEVVPLAAYKESDVQLSFHIDDSFYSAASSLYGEDTKNDITVNTTTIDKICREKKLSPSLIKIDIEGGEADALTGGKETIKRCRPILLLEFNPFAENSIKLVQSLGYDVYDLNTYEIVKDDYFDGKYTTNVVCVPHERSCKFELGPIIRFEGGLASVDAGPGVISYQLSYSGSGVGSLNCVGPDGKLIAYFQAEFSHLSHHSCSAIPFCTPTGGQLSCAVQTVSGDGEILIVGSSVKRLQLVKSKALEPSSRACR